MTESEIKKREQIVSLISDIYRERKEAVKFTPGVSWVQYAGSIFDDKEVNAIIETVLDGWFGLGQKGESLEKSLSEFLGTKGSVLSNSGSSSNFLAVASLMSPLFERHLQPGDEVITLACGFPTTVNPIIQHGLIPVFIDVEMGTYNINLDILESAVSAKTKALFIPHTLGNPNDMDRVVAFCEKHNLYLIEDNCDALGSEFKGRKTGSFGILSTQSFYPPHHITMGEGGAINYNDTRLDRIIRSLRDWGRACYCRGDEKHHLGTCRNRFNFKIDGRNCDHKYMYNQIGYNLKPIEPQAAMGVEQFKRIPEFTRLRRKNFARMYEHAKNWEKFFILPHSIEGADPSWFAFVLTLRDGVKFDRFELITCLEERMIQTRPLFAGNILKHPAYKDIKCRVVGDLKNSDKILFDTFFLGVYPGLVDEAIDYIAETIQNFLNKY